MTDFVDDAERERTEERHGVPSARDDYLRYTPPVERYPHGKCLVWRAGAVGGGLHTDSLAACSPRFPDAHRSSSEGRQTITEPGRAQ